MNDFLSFWPQPLFPENTQTGSIAGSSANVTVKIGHVYKIVANVDWFMKVGLSTNATPVATTSDIFIPAGSIQVLIADGWDTLAFIQSSGAGKVSVTEVRRPL